MKAQTQPIDRALLNKALTLNSGVSKTLEDLTSILSILPALLQEINRLQAGPAGWSENYQKTALKRVGLDGEFSGWGIDAIESVGRALVKTRLERDAYRQRLYQIAARGCEVYGMFNLTDLTGKMRVSGCGECDRCSALDILSKTQLFVESEASPSDVTQKIN